MIEPSTTNRKMIKADFYPRIFTIFLCCLIGINFVEGAEDRQSYREYSRHHDGVLGTSLDISIYIESQKNVAEVVDDLVEHIARMESIFSTYRSDSEIVRLNNERVSNQISADLLTVIGLCRDWNKQSEGKFSCRLGQLIELWNGAEREQKIPERPTVRQLARRANQAELTISDDGSMVMLGEFISLDPSGLSKGYIIDKAIALLRKNLPLAIAIKVDIGGDAAYWGTPPGQNGWQVGIANPLDTADNSGYVSTLALTSMSVAASGHNSRNRLIERREFSHILTPRDGWPVESGLAAVVVAQNAITADAVATALSVQTAAAAIDWVNALDGVEALVISSDGRQMVSENWQRFRGDVDLPEITSTLDFHLGYVLPKFNVTSYNRPYVAIWVTDLKQKPIKNLLVLGASERWARENTRWWRRVGRRNSKLLDGVARPTRGAGEYTLQWGGLDDFGKLVPAGDYLLHFEASRENGSSSYQSIAFSLGADDMLLKLPAEGELGEIILEIKN